MILAVSTHSNNIQIAVKSSKNIYLNSLNAKVSQSKKILHMIDATLKDAGVSKKDIRSLYINSGPGMFTSLRVGIACINAISFVLKIPIYQFTTFDLYAVSALQKNIKFPFGVGIDAKMSETYFTIFESPEDIFNQKRKNELIQNTELLTKLEQDELISRLLGDFLYNNCFQFSNKKTIFKEDFDLKDLLEFKIQNVKETKIAKPYYLRNQVTS